MHKNYTKTIQTQKNVLIVYNLSLTHRAFCAWDKGFEDQSSKAKKAVLCGM